MAGEGVSLRMVPGELEQALCLDWGLEETGRNGMPPRLIPQCGEGAVGVEHHFPGAVHSVLPGAGLAPAFPWSPIHLFFFFLQEQTEAQEVKAADKAYYRAQAEEAGSEPGCDGLQGK